MTDLLMKTNPPTITNEHNHGLLTVVFRVHTPRPRSVTRDVGRRAKVKFHAFITSLVFFDGFTLSIDNLRRTIEIMTLISCFSEWLPFSNKQLLCSCHLSIRKAIGLESVKVEKAGVRDIVSIGGLKDVQVGDTLAHIEVMTCLPLFVFDQPECSMVFGVNDSPFAGHDGKKVFLMMSTSNLNLGFVSNHTTICVNTCGLDHLHKSASSSALSLQQFMLSS
ncbi:translational GTPase TypA [Artemisia annua]|uniref:Translational GTPase TypA n=1 Tax=Artemisia annua TaxID=35608 RepID=A0A2U1PJA4_ARTAN|nr:translational GTPase TypA [Artemisia annua]